MRTTEIFSRASLFAFALCSLLGCQNSRGPDESSPDNNVNNPSVVPIPAVPTPPAGPGNGSNPGSGPVSGPSGPGSGSDPDNVAGPTPNPGSEIKGQGYYVASYSKPQSVAILAATPIDFAKSTHVMVVGEAKAIQLQFLEAATTRAKRWLEVFPSDQVVVIAFNEVGGPDMRSQFATWGWENVRYQSAALNAQQLFLELNPLRKIESFDMFSHSVRDAANLSNGATLSTSNDTFDGVDWAQLKGNFSAMSFAVFFGCNNGFALAPYLSSKWGIPVAGTLTSSDLQQPHSNGQFYANNDNTKPVLGNWSLTNSTSFFQSLSCASGACIRMKPDPFPYSGIHGNYREGLPFTKFFCAENSDDDCARRMARSLLAWPSLKPLRTVSALADWKMVVADHMCPIHARRPLRENCLKALPSIEAGGLPKYTGDFMGREISCDFQGCTEGSVPAELNSTSTFVREYLRYLNGLTLLGIL